MPGLTYVYGEDANGDAFIQCLDCGARSYHPEDIANRYCGRCHQFHEIKAAARGIAAMREGARRAGVELR